MAQLYEQYPRDTDAGAFYALALLAAEAPNDTSLTQNAQGDGGAQSVVREVS